MYKCVNSQAPEYLMNLVSFKKSVYSTRSSSDITLLVIPKTKTTSGDKAFQVAGPRLWNSLPKKHQGEKNCYSFQKHS